MITFTHLMFGCVIRLPHRFFSTTPLLSTNMRVLVVPALSDNYMYLLVDDVTKQCAAIDPVEPRKILAEAKKHGLTLTCVLTTHHHWDHAGGNSELYKSLSHPIPIYGGSNKIEAVTKVVSHDEKITVGDEVKITCLHTPCHTMDHICYYATNSDGSSGCVFTGDTLFLGGCGRFFEGDAEQMYHALVEVLGQLPDSTQVFCGHEYTSRNLEFAATVAAGDSEVALEERRRAVAKMRAEGRPTVPGSIAEERATNPFLRVADPALWRSLGVSTPVDAMAVLRRRKDLF